MKAGHSLLASDIDQMEGALEPRKYTVYSRLYTVFKKVVDYSYLN